MPSRPPEPLSGRRIVVTRPRHQAAALSSPLSRLGATVIEAPSIRIEAPKDPAPLENALASVERYDWIVFTSVNGVTAFFDRRSSPGPARVAAIGPATAEALSTRDVEPDLVPERYVAEAVFEALQARDAVAGRRFLLPRADIAREALPRLLASAGAEVDVVTAYRTLPDEAGVTRAVELVRQGAADVVTFTSGSTVRSLLEAATSEVRERLAAASIGPITSEALRREGVTPVVEASEYTCAGLVAAMVRHFTEIDEETT